MICSAVVEVAAGGDLLQNVVGTTMRPPVIRDETVSDIYMAGTWMHQPSKFGPNRSTLKSLSRGTCDISKELCYT